MAAEKGFYKDMGLDIKIEPGGPGIFSIQEIADKNCPSVFTLAVNKDDNILNERYHLDLCCEKPGEWHKLENDAGRYDITRPAETLRRIAPHAAKLGKILKATIPSLAAGMELAFDDASTNFKGESKLFASTTSILSGSDPDTTFDHDKLGHQQMEGWELEDFRDELKKLEAKQKKNLGGLKRVPTPEGHVLWLCPKHKKEFDS